MKFSYKGKQEKLTHGANYLTAAAHEDDLTVQNVCQQKTILAL